jgi:hypothetical protein
VSSNSTSTPYDAERESKEKVKLSAIPIVLKICVAILIEDKQRLSESCPKKSGPTEVSVSLKLAALVPSVGTILQQNELRVGNILAHR